MCGDEISRASDKYIKNIIENDCCTVLVFDFHEAPMCDWFSTVWYAVMMTRNTDFNEYHTHLYSIIFDILSF